MRAFNSFLLKECYRLTQDPSYESAVLERTSRAPKSSPHLALALASHPFTFYHDIKIVMYCSEAPCGDASQEMVMAAQKDPTPWTRIVDGSQDQQS